MKINDTVLAAFLVSMGLFSAFQAKAYVASLSDKDKQALMPITSNAEKNLVASASPIEWPDTTRKRV
jgi:hypothetical protein